MTKYILHGGFTRHQNKLNDDYYKEIARDIPDDGNVLVVHFAWPENEIEERFAGEKACILAQADEEKNISVTLASAETFINQIKQADALSIVGGHTPTLLATLKRFPELGEALAGKTVAGSSAGAYVLSKWYHSASTDSIHEGLGLVPVRTICHFESSEFKTRGNPLEQMENYPHDLELVVLRDHEWRIFNL